jgi:hypothetical protein
MAGILDYNKGIYSTQEFRNRLLTRNLPPPINETLVQSGLVSKLQDIGKVINVPVMGTQNENIPIHYDEDKKLFPLGTLFRMTQNVNLNKYKPQNDQYITFELKVPPVLWYPLPTSFGPKSNGFYPISYNKDQFTLISDGVKKGVIFPFNVIDSYKSLNFQKETSLGILGGQQLEKTVIDKIGQVEGFTNDEQLIHGYITPPLGNRVNEYVNRMRGSAQFFNTLPNGAVGWNEYNSSVKSGDELLKTNLDIQEGVEPTLSTELRMKVLFERTSVQQVSFAFSLLNRNSYRPEYVDTRLAGTENAGLNSRYYIGTERNTNRGNRITTRFTNKDFNGSIDNTGNGQRTTIEGIGEPSGEENKFFWSTGGEQNFNPKTLLYKTQQLVNNSENDVFINQTKKYFRDKEQDRIISRGNAIRELSLLDVDGNANFCRVWTVNDRYNYFNAIRNTGLFFNNEPGHTGDGFSADGGKASLSVLMPNGIPKYHPSILDSKTTRKKFMLSLENLAWADNLADLPLFEIGPGDPLTGTKGRIMWFPPYELTFDENTSANWTPTEFIGRSEPVYTYNNSKRSGSISFKIIVDHPRVINCYRGMNNNLVERFFAGCVTPEDFIRALECAVPQTDIDLFKVKINEKEKPKTNIPEKQQEPGTVLYDQDVNCSATTENCKAKRVINEPSFDKLKILSLEFIKKQLNNTNPKVLITLNGFASNEVDFNNVDPNVTATTVASDLTKDLKNKLTDFLQQSLSIQTFKNITFKDEGGTGVESTESSAYRVDVLMENDTENSTEALPPEKSVTPEEIDPTDAINLIDNLIIDEGPYFDFIDANYPNYFKTISEKIRYFHAGFHSITPEGLNSRLTFLNQCMRQGPSIYDKKTSKDGVEVGVQPQNLSFGRPPICILRIGDFFHTKVAINSLQISYDGPQWDLNPEGIGIQPMIATVSLSIDLIGGHSLVGPINRLQNAVSFNYYANTEMYDVRSDTIEDGKIKDGVKLGQLKEKLIGKDKVKTIYGSLKTQDTIDQVKQNEKTTDTDQVESDNPIEIVIINNEIVARTRGNKLPSVTNPTDKENSADALNQLYMVVKSGSEDIEVGPNNIVNLTLPISQIKDLAKPSEITTYDNTITTRETELATAKAIFENNKNEKNRKAVKTAENNLKFAQQDKESYLKTKKDKIKVVAYFTKNKGKTKVNKDFTVTANGIN